MELEKILKLIDAGFTTDDIRRISDTLNPVTSPEAVQEPSNPAPAADPEPGTAPTPAEPAADPEPKAAPTPAAPAASAADSAIVAGLEAQIKTLSDSIAKMTRTIIMPSLENVQPLGVEDIITNFFKED